MSKGETNWSHWQGREEELLTETGAGEEQLITETGTGQPEELTTRKGGGEKR